MREGCDGAAPPKRKVVVRRTRRVWLRPAAPSVVAPTVDRPDLRTREGKAFERTRRELIAQLGGKPTLTQELLVHRVAALAARAAQLDREVAENAAGTDGTTTEYLRLIGMMDRLLNRLGLAADRKPVGDVEPVEPDIHTYLAQKRRRREAEAERTAAEADAP